MISSPSYKLEKEQVCVIINLNVCESLIEYLNNSPL